MRNHRRCDGRRFALGLGGGRPSLVEKVFFELLEMPDHFRRERVLVQNDADSTTAQLFYKDVGLRSEFRRNGATEEFEGV